MFSKSKSLKRRIESHQQYRLMESPHYLRYNELVAKALPVLEFLSTAVNRAKFKKVNDKGLKPLLEDLSPPTFADLQWLDVEAVGTSKGMEHELTSEALMEKAALCAVALHCVSNTAAARQKQIRWRCALP